MISEIEENRDNPFEFLFQRLPFGVIRQDAQGYVLDANPAAEQMLGVKRIQIHERLALAIGEDGSRLPEDRQPAALALLNGRPIHNLVLGIPAPSSPDSPRWFNINAEPRIRPGEDKPYEVHTILEEITGHKRLEDSLRAIEVRYRLMTDNISDVIWVMDPVNDRFTYVSPSVEKLRGYTVEEVMAQPVSESLTPESLKIVNESLAQKLPSFIKKGQGTLSTLNEVDQPCKDGSIVRTEVVTTYMFNPSGKIEIIGVTRDITARKKAEQSLQASEKRYRDLFEDSPVALWEEDFSAVKTRVDELRQNGVTDFTAYFKEHPQEVGALAKLVKVLDVNKAAVLMVAAKQKEDLIKSLADSLPQETIQGFDKEILHITRGNTEFSWEGKNMTLAGDLIDVHLQWSVVPGHEQDYARVIVSVMNVTAQKQAEKELRKSEQNYRGLLEQASDGIFISDPEGQYILVNKAACDLVGYSKEELLSLNLRDLLPPEEILKQPLRLDELRSGKTVLIERMLLHKDGRRIPCELSAIQLPDGRFQSFVRNIAKRKQAEEAQLRNEQRYRTLFENSPIAIWEEDFSRAKKYLDELQQAGVADLEAFFASHPDELEKCARMIEITNVNQAALRMYGAKTKRELIETVHQIIGSGERLHIHEDFQAMVAGRRGNRWEGTDETVSGERLEIILQWSVLPGYEQDYSRIILTTLDVTETKKAGQALRESESRFHAMFEKHNAVMLLVEPHSGRIVDANEAAEDFYGYPAARLKSMSIEEINTLPPGEVAQRRMDALTKGLNYFVFPHRLANGEIRSVEVHSSPITIEGRPVLFSIIHDVTLRQQAEESIRESEIKFHSLVDQSADGVVLVEPSGIIIEWNHAQELITGISRSEAIGSTFWETQQKVMLPERKGAGTLEYWKNAFFETFLTEKSPLLEKAHQTGLLSTNGERKIVLQTAFLIKSEKGARIGAIVRDITEQKQAEEKLRATLEEKEVLLREVHHRVKNNLQAMIALMDMQASQIEDRNIITFLTELEGQARAMSLVYEQLYQSENLARVDLASYLRQLTGNISETFGRNSMHRLELEVDSISVDVAQAMPCGLIVNELYTNILKHAFPPGYKGSPVARIELHQTGGEIRLSVADNGVGMPQDFDWRKSRSLGMRLVNLWVTHQLGGALEINNHTGTIFIITFKV